MAFLHLHFDEIDSTSSYLKSNYEILDNFTFVSAGYQTKGKGREDRIWESNKNENLLFSILIKDQNIIRDFSVLSLSCAAIVALYLSNLGIENVFIKWPNDVYVNNKKICGILLEGNLLTHIIIGVGLNVNQSIFPEGLRNPPTSIFNELNTNQDINILKEKLFDLFYEKLKDFSNNKTSLLQYVIENNYLKDKNVEFTLDNIKKVGHVTSIEESGYLLIECENEIISLNTGEIKII